MTNFEKLLTTAQALYDNGDPSHDWLHIQRVLQTCEKLSAAEGAELEVVRAAALLHDVVNVPKNHPDRMNASKLAAERARGLLIEAGYSEHEIKRIEQAIIEHSYSLGLKPSSIEAAVLQDADKLDALGAIGVMRTVTCGARMGTSYYKAGSLFPHGREADDKSFTIDHFFVKLLKLPERMNTTAGKLEAARRADFMKAFLDQLESEVMLSQ